MDTLATRIKKRMKDLGMTQEMLAHKMGITRGAITHYIANRRVPPLNQFKKLAAILKSDPAWLQYGTLTTVESKTVSKKEKAEILKNSIPILSWERIAEFVDASKITDEIKEFIPHFYTDESRWYALRIIGDAMTASLGHGKSFHEGDIIIVDPDKTAVHGSFVVALLPRSKEATFKQYVIDGGIRYLKPLNPQYPMIQIDESTHICGVVVNYLSML